MLPTFDAWRVSAVSLDVLAAGRGGRDGILARQARRLSALLDVALARSALYRRLCPKHDASLPALRDLPVVTKEVLMAHFDEWVTDPRLRLDAMRARLADMKRIGEPFAHGCYVWESSGSTGHPGVFVQDAQSLAVCDALEALRRPALRPIERWVDPWYVGERLAFIGATGGHFATTVSVERLRRLNPWMTAKLRSFSFLAPTHELVAQLNDHAPTVVATYPTAAVLLAEQALAGELRIAPKEIWTGGEALTPSMRAIVRRAFGCPVVSSYGASEFLAMACECPLQRLHLNADWLILEPVDESYRPVPEGVRGHTTLLTNLANHVQPLIRYDLGDSVTLHTEPCACGSPLPVVEVEGRTDEALLMQDGRGGVARLLPLALTTVLEDEAGVFDFQIEQQDGRALMLRVNAYGPDRGVSVARAQATLAAYLQRMSLSHVHIEARCEPIERGKSGKAPRVVRAPDRPPARRAPSAARA